MAQFTKQQLDTLNAAIAQGALTVEYGDKKVTYRSLDDMYRVRRDMMIDLGLLSPTSGRHYAAFSKGFNPNNGK